MAKLTGSVTKYPARAGIVWYLGLILLGTLVLAHPLCGASAERPITWLDALFTATSATCVTGLVVRSTVHDFSLIGQMVILSLIQLGGIGIMTVTTYVMFKLGGRQSLHHRVVISETLGTDSNSDLGWILRNVILLTVGFEGCGFVLLAVRHAFEQPLGLALWHALFHSISAFCNAGFALHDDSLTTYRNDWLVTSVICGLVIVGGIGFPVILDIGRNWNSGWPGAWTRLHLHSKLMLIGTVTLLFLGTGAFLLLEWDGVLSDTPYARRPLIAFFHATSCRTAGFNTVDIASLTNATLFISILLMVIGAGPGSTAGGFKVSTVMVLVLQAQAVFRGQRQINLFRRTIPEQTVARALATAMLFGVVAVMALTTLLVFEQSAQPHPVSQGIFLEATFEVASALATVGLSAGLTTQLTVAGQVIIVMLMFLGRLGPISVFAALSGSARGEKFEFPSEEPLIG